MIPRWKPGLPWRRRGAAGYCIKPGYRSRRRPSRYEVSPEDSVQYQVEVYEHAGRLAAAPDVRSVLDIGCGLGTKLVEYIGPHCATTGLDTERSITSCRQRFPGAEWIAVDLDAPEPELDRTFDLIVSVDVIEHLPDPDLLIELVRRSSHADTRVVISTPERDLRRGTDDMGPPANAAHVREWNQAEFAAYLASHGFVIHDSAIVDTRPGLRTCQMVTGAFHPTG